jgi:hypothetical protein
VLGLSRLVDVGIACNGSELHRTIALPAGLTADEAGREGAAGDDAGCCAPSSGKGGALEEHGGSNWVEGRVDCGGVELQSCRLDVRDRAMRLLACSD